MKSLPLDEDAYEKLARYKRDSESFSDAIRRLTGDFTLAEYYGCLSEETADELTAILESRRR